MKSYVFILFFVLPFSLAAAKALRWGGVLSNNAVSFPVAGSPKTVYAAFHPGVDFFLEHPINKNLKNQLWMSYHGGIYYHRFFQTGLRAYTNFEYRRTIGNRCWLHAGLQLGYLHALTDYDRFVLNDQGSYEKIPNWYGRSQILFGINLGASYRLSKKENGIRGILMIRSFLQTPFAGSYVPILPTNSLMLGVSLPIHKKEKTK